MSRFVRRFTVLAGVLSTALACKTEAQTLIAGWDFQTTTSGGTAVAVGPTIPILYNANVGTGTLYLNGSNGASSWSQTTELDGSYTGTAINAAPGMATSTTAPACVALLGGTSLSANGKSIVFRVATTNYSTVQLTYATQRSSTAFTTHTWAYSTNGTTWTALGTFTSLPATFGVLTLPASAGPANVANAYFRLTVTGAVTPGGYNRLDNVQILGNGIPLPLSDPQLSAERRGPSVRLHWQATGEPDLAHYVVERSQDGTDYKPLATLAADAAASHQWTDDHPGTGPSFYRLKLATTTGTASYSATVRVAGLSPAPALLVAPNPAVRGSALRLTLAGMPEGRYHYRIGSADGRLVQEGNLDHTSDEALHTLPTGALPPGLLSLTLTGPAGTLRRQVLVVE